MSEDQTPRIEEKEDGPLIAVGIESMVDHEGEAIPVKPRMPLCRCGRSSTKPFCDGTHRMTGFDQRAGKEPSGEDTVRAYQGKEITILYNPRICSHAAECVARVPESFHPGDKPWITPDDASEEKLREAVRACPSGALQVQGEGQLIPERAQIVVEKNGPYRVTEVPIIGSDVPGKEGTEEKFVLCRCGLSGNKPYCDGSHHGKEWDDSLS